MNGTSPTRMNLLTRRSQLGLALRGVDLLQKKRDALVKEFFSMVHEALEARRRLNEAAHGAHMALFLAEAFDGPGRWKSSRSAYRSSPMLGPSWKTSGARGYCD